MKRSKFEGEDIIDSRDIIERLDELRLMACPECDKDITEDIPEMEELEPFKCPHCGEEIMDTDDREEWDELSQLEAEIDGAGDWYHGETLIRWDYFTEYIKELINDCYEMPKEFDSGNWPWTHMEMDWDGAAEYATQDYMSVTLFGHEYWIRNC